MSAISPGNFNDTFSLISDLYCLHFHLKPAIQIYHAEFSEFNGVRENMFRPAEVSR